MTRKTRVVMQTTTITFHNALKNKIDEVEHKPKPKFSELNDNVELYLRMSGDTVLRDKLRDPQRKSVWHTPTDQ